MGDPAQIVGGDEVKVTLTGKFVFTIIPIELEVAGLFEMQTVNEDVSMHFTTSPFTGV